MVVISLIVFRYTMFKHDHETNNAPNPNRFKQLEVSYKYFETDGLNNLR